MIAVRCGELEEEPEDLRRRKAHRRKTWREPRIREIKIPVPQRLQKRLTTFASVAASRAAHILCKDLRTDP